MPTCEYTPPGVEAIRLLDFEDFAGFQFVDDSAYASCLVSDVLRRDGSPFVDVYTSESAKYSSTFENGVYTHKIETLIPSLGARETSLLHRATKRRYIVLFRTKAGKYHIFGYKAGASVVYSGRTDEDPGYILTLTARSVYPLFERREEQKDNFFEVTPGRVILDYNDSTVIRVNSSSPWHIADAVPDFATFSLLQGEAGSFNIAVQGLRPGEDYATFVNEEGAEIRIYIRNINNKPWILDTGYWDSAGMWYDEGLWNF